MKKNTIEEAIANIAFTSSEIEKYSNDPDNGCSPWVANFMETMSRELHKHSSELKEIKNLYMS